MKQGNDENVAKAAAQCKENNLDITDCEIWMLDHQHDSKLISDLVDEFDKESGTDTTLCYETLLPGFYIRT